MKRSLGLVSLVVRDYDEALAFFIGKRCSETQIVILVLLKIKVSTM